MMGPAEIESCATCLVALASSGRVSEEVSHELTNMADGLRSHLNFREKAKMCVKDVCVDGLVRDIREVKVGGIDRPAAISCWRHCAGIRLWKSESVTKAMRFMCSAPIDGLDGQNAIDVINRLTSKEESAWPHYFFVWGGTVRDLLRGEVGNDIDMVFTAPTTEISKICDKLRFQHRVGDDNYIVIGDENSDTCMEGYPVDKNSITPAYHSDFSMNWVFYDFVNDVIVDKTGDGLRVIRANLVEIPCPRFEWEKWGHHSRLFRYYKFAARGKNYHKIELAYVASRLLQFWRVDEHETVEQGREALSSMKKPEQKARLRELVLESFDLAMSTEINQELVSSRVLKVRVTKDFESAERWWQESWRPMLGW